MEPQKINLLIADDHPLLVEGLSNILKGANDVIIQSVAFNGREVLNILAKQQPDVILLDINMPKLNGMEAIKAISKGYPKVHIIVFTTYNEVFLIKKAREYGAHAYLLKTCGSEELLRTIRLVKNGGSYFPPIATEDQPGLVQKEDFLKTYKLTQREMDIIRLIKEGLLNKQIAENLFLSVYTVETHRKNIMIKLNLKNPSQLWNFIISHNL